jgi:hypothetical protein
MTESRTPPPRRYIAVREKLKRYVVAARGALRRQLDGVAIDCTEADSQTTQSRGDRRDEWS